MPSYLLLSRRSSGTAIDPKSGHGLSLHYRDLPLSIFVAAYVFYLGKSLSGPTPREVLELPVLSTICLLSSSITVVLAERAFHKDRSGLFKIWWLVTIVLALFFLGETAREWRTLIYEKGLTISTNLFGTTFYSLVGLHASHVIVGLCLLVLIFILSLRGSVMKIIASASR
jgi:cytochrome c oxidase subunit 3/cytochrome o ubiquinol oxidase subunit 3